MFPYASIHPEVASAATDLLRFDYYRLVDPRDHRVFAYDRDGDRLIEVDGPCYQLWNQDDPCLNCSSRACLTMQDAVFKIEYLDGRVLHVTSVPMDIEGAELVLELIKDVTDSLLVADIEVRDNIEITQMITKFNELAVRDGFTKLYNKTFINNELESLVQAARGGSPAGEAAVVLLDIDGFKQINDTYGHIAGDDALQYFASKMRSFSRSFDGWVGRFGGDEFVLCAPKGLSEGDLSVCSLRSTRSSAMRSRLRRGRSRLRQVAACASCGRMTPFARCWIALTLPCTGRRKAAEGGLSARACGAPSRCAVDFAIRRSAIEPLVEGTRAIRRSGRSRQGSARCHPERNDRRTVPSWRRSTSASKVEASRTHVVSFTCAPCASRRCTGGVFVLQGRRLF